MRRLAFCVLGIALAAGSLLWTGGIPLPFASRDEDGLLRATGTIEVQEVTRAPKIGGDRSGSGDAFAAIVAASLIRGEELEAAVQKAASFISRCLAYALELDLPWNYGLPFEEYLTELR